MSQENVEIVRRMLAAAAAGQAERALEFFDPEVLVDATRFVINPGTYVGFDGLERWQADIDEVWDEFRLEPIEFVDAGDRIVVMSQLIGKGKGSGVEVTRTSSAQVATIRNGHIVRWEIGFTDRGEASKPPGCGSSQKYRFGREAALPMESATSMDSPARRCRCRRRP
jgi:ketosteroid isomerase-like protein